MSFALLVGVFFFLLIAGVPIAFALGLAPAAYLIQTGNFPLILIAQQAFKGLDSFVFLAIPFFILAGFLMEKGKIAQHLIDLSDFLLNRFVGGLGMAVSMACAIFASISGSGPATTAAIGGATLPALVEKGYGRRWGTAFIAVAGTIGPVIPPSITMVIYGGMAGISIGQLFIAGIVPGLMMALVLMIISYFHAKKVGVAVERRKFSLAEGWVIFRRSIWALGMPVVILGGIMGGVFTPTEAAVVSVVYALIVTLFIYKTLKLKDLGPIFRDAAVTTGLILIILANASSFAWILAAEQGPQMLTQGLFAISSDPLVILILVNVFLLILGCFVDTTSALVMVTPVLVPLAKSLGIDPVHLGLIVTVNLVIGMATPPLGITLFTACSIGKVSIADTFKPILPMIGLMILVLLVVTYFPGFVMFLPKLFFN